MAAPNPNIGGSGDAAPTAPIFATYLEARAEARHRAADDALNGRISRVMKSPYGGFVVRSLPVEMLADLEVRRSGISGIVDKLAYKDL